MLSTPLQARVALLRWIEDRVPLDYCLVKPKLTEWGLEGQEYFGECVATQLLGNRAKFELGTGTMTLCSDSGLVIEPWKNFADGFEVQVRYPNYGVWLLLKRH